MDSILIATDFSSAARTATVYGFELARLTGAKVILFTGYEYPVVAAGSASYKTPYELEKSSYQKLVEEAETLDPQRTVALGTETRNGPVSDSIISIALQHKVSFIIVGMKKRGKEVRKYFGSTVTDLCKLSQIPLIVVPADAAFSVPTTIALASDITTQTEMKLLDPLKKIAGSFGSSLFVVRVIKKSMDEAAEKKMQSEKLNWTLTSLNPQFEYTKAENVAKAMNAFVKQHNVNMVAVIPHEHSLFERLFTRSVTKDLIFHTHVPLLILPYKNEGVIGEEQETYDNELAFNIY